MQRKSKDKLANRLVRLSENLAGIGLDLNWVLSISALSAQEVAIKKKLNEFGLSYGEAEDFQNLASKLEQAYKEQGLTPPMILLSISRSYRHIRAKLIHEGHRYKISEEEAKGILSNTQALIDKLFEEQEFELGKPQAIRNLTDEDIMDAVKRVNPEQLTRIVKSAFDEISKIETGNNFQNNRRFCYLIRCAIKEREQDRIRLFEMFLNAFFPTTVNMNFELTEELLSILADSVQIVSVRDWIVEKGHADKLVSELVRSRSFDMAGINTGMIVRILPYLTKKQLTTLINAAISNDQIHLSYNAKPNLNAILDSCEGKVDETRLKVLRKKLE